MSRSDDTTSQPGSTSSQGTAESAGAGGLAGAGSEGASLAAVVAERDALQAELAEARQLAEADVKALAEDSDRYIAELIAEHDAERAQLQNQVQDLEAQVEALQGQVDGHAIERYELVQQRDAAQRALEEAGGDLAQPPPAPAESAALSELAAELAEVRAVVAQVTDERDELLLALESTKADSVIEQDRLVAELVESHHEEVASLSGELDSVSAAVLETEQELDAARAEVAALEQQVAVLSQPPAEESAPAELERRVLEAESELQRLHGENAVLHRMVEAGRGDSGAPLGAPGPQGSPTPPSSHAGDLGGEAEVELSPPQDDLRATMPSVDEGPSGQDTPELAVEEWGAEPPWSDEPGPTAPPEADYANMPLDGPVEGQPAAAQDEGAPAWELELPNGGAPGTEMGSAAPEWELEVPSGGTPGPAPAAGVPDWELEGPRMSAEVTTEPPSSGDGPSITMAEPSDPASDDRTSPPEEDPTEWQLEEGQPPVEPDLAAPAPGVDLRDQTPTVPPRRPAGEQQESVPTAADDADDGTYSFVAPRKRRKKRPR